METGTQRGLSAIAHFLLNITRGGRGSSTLALGQHTPTQPNARANKQTNKRSNARGQLRQHCASAVPTSILNTTGWRQSHQTVRKQEHQPNRRQHWFNWDSACCAGCCLGYRLGPTCAAVVLVQHIQDGVVCRLWLVVHVK